jgi:hypothetical protein
VKNEAVGMYADSQSSPPSKHRPLEGTRRPVIPTEAHDQILLSDQFPEPEQDADLTSDFSFCEGNH